MRFPLITPSEVRHSVAFTEQKSQRNHFCSIGYSKINSAVIEQIKGFRILILSLLLISGQVIVYVRSTKVTLISYPINGYLSLIFI